MKLYLIEFKNRVTLVFLVQISTFLILYYQKTILLFLILHPILNLEGSSEYSFIFTDITEPFSLYCNLIFFIDIQIVMIYLFCQIFIFVIPALYQSEFRNMHIFIKTMFLLLVLSAVTTNLFIIPWTWFFFLDFYITSNASIFNLYFEAKLVGYLNFYVTCYWVNFLYFQFIGLLFYVLNLPRTTLNRIKKFRKFCYAGFVSVTALTCPDMFSQLILVAALIFSFEVNLFRKLCLSFRQ